MTSRLMKRNTTIVLFASIFAVAVGTLGLSGNSATLMVSAVPQSQEQVGMLGHVEYMVQDYSGNIVSYMQTDNVVVNDGEDCVAEDIFGVGTSCELGAGNFDYIGIGNGSSAATSPTNATLADATIDDTGTCASSGVGGDMARRQVTPSLVSAAAGAIGAVVELDTTVPFTFDTHNATSVIDSGIFNADYDTPSATHTCGGANAAHTNWEMFSRQLLNGATGIAVNNGDSLSVKWTITVG